MTEADEISRGREARSLMEHPLMVEAFDTIERGLVDSLADMPLKAEGLEREAVRSLQILRKVRRELQTVMETGRLAELGKTERESLMQKLRRAVA